MERRDKNSSINYVHKKRTVKTEKASHEKIGKHSVTQLAVHSGNLGFKFDKGKKSLHFLPLVPEYLKFQTFLSTSIYSSKEIGGKIFPITMYVAGFFFNLERKLQKFCTDANLRKYPDIQTRK